MKDMTNGMAVRKVYSGTVSAMTDALADIMGFSSATFLIDFDDKGTGTTATVSFKDSETEDGTFEDVSETATIIPYMNETGTLSASNPVDRVGYIGGKRFVKPVITTSSSVTTETVNIYAILENGFANPIN